MGKPSLKAFEQVGFMALRIAIRSLLDDPVIANTIDQTHTANTPNRVASAFEEMFSGCLEDPVEALDTMFPSAGYDQLICVKDITFYSVCCHHLLPFVGTAVFSYIPAANVVGLSKIPRLVHVYAKRPQIQEKLTEEIVTTFMDIVKPKGCGLVMRAYHFCMCCRGVGEPKAFTETTALRGNFKEPLTKNEFIQAAQAITKVWL